MTNIEVPAVKTTARKTAAKSKLSFVEGVGTVLTIAPKTAAKKVAAKTSKLVAVEPITEAVAAPAAKTSKTVKTAKIAAVKEAKPTLSASVVEQLVAAQSAVTTATLAFEAQIVEQLRAGVSPTVLSKTLSLANSSIRRIGWKNGFNTPEAS